MSKPCEYIVSGALMKCNKGTRKSVLLSTHPSIHIKGVKACTTLAYDDISSAGRFGYCTMRNKQTCTPVIDKIEDYKKAVFFKAGEPLLVKTRDICVFKGEISFITSGQDVSLERFLELLGKVENAYPNLNKETLMSALRALSEFYDTDTWGKILNTQKVPKVKPVEDALAGDELFELRNMLAHYVEKGTEMGVIIDRTGEKVAIGHVLTGITAGLNRDKSRDITPAKYFWFGEDIDNLYTSTIAGDMGQSAVLVDMGKQKGYIGLGTEATRAELIGDLDGAIIGEFLRSSDEFIFNAWHTNIPLSDFLDMYYTRYAGVRFKNAAEWLPTLNEKDHLKTQIKKFADNYSFKKGSKIHGLTANEKPEAEAAYQAYQQWILEEYKKEKNNSDIYSPNGLVTDGSC